MTALGRHSRLFASYSYYAGNKTESFRLGPCIDDEAKYIGTNFADLYVETE